MGRKYVSVGFMGLVKQFEKCKDDEARMTELELRYFSCVQLLGAFPMPHPDNRVEYDFWYSSENKDAIEFLADFQEMHEKYNDDVYFTPRIFSFECKS